MAAVSSRGIFLSYRREDAAPYARLLQSQLRERFPDADVFMDLDSIEAGLDFAEVIREAVDSCAVLVALIGPQWATLADEEGRRRLDNPNDYVRFEVHTALERHVRVIPVLIDSARPPRPEQLPSELQRLARLNAHKLSYDRYEYDADRLLNIIQRVLDEASGTGTVHQSRPAANVDVRPDGNALGPAAPKEPTAIRKNQARATRILTEAEYLAHSIPDEESKAIALAEVASGLAATDPDRAARLIADAERIAQSITLSGKKNLALVGIAWSLANTDPDRAARIAQSIPDESQKFEVLADIARALVATYPDGAARLIADTELVARRISDDEGLKANALGNIASALVATDPDRAARLIADAERIAQSIPNEYDMSKGEALLGIVYGLAATDPDRAERLAHSIPDEDWKDDALGSIARTVAATDPDHAERIAQTITSEDSKVRPLADIARGLMATDPDRAARLSADAERIAQSIPDEGRKARALFYIVKTVAATDPDRAERIAQSITREDEKVAALVAIAKA